MNPQILTKAQPALVPSLETDSPEMDGLAGCGFTAEESAALFWLRGWYQSGGSDRMQLVRNFEFLKWLVKMGKLEV
jgi:hypothetical protein